MVWPHLTPKVIPLGEDPILQVSASNSVGMPTVILTNKALHLFNPQHHVIIATHNRSEESLLKYGENITFKVNYQQDIVCVSSSQGFLLVYSILRTDEELLSVYSKSSELLQNGLVLNKQFSFFEKLHIENPIISYQLRFKIVLKIHHQLKDFVLLDKYEMVLVTSTNVQLLDLHTSNDEIVKFEGKPIDKLIHSRPLKGGDAVIFFVIDSDNRGRLFSKTGTDFKTVNDFVAEEVIDASINVKQGLILLIHADRKRLTFYNYRYNAVVHEITYQDSIESAKWNKNNSGYSLLFSNKTWSTHSIFGSCFFKSTEFDDINAPWLNNITDFDIAIDQSYIFLTDSSTIYTLPLFTNLNVGSPINSNLKRPILVSNGEIRIYSTYENKSNSWNIIKVPYEEYHQLIQIYQACLSNDYKFLAVSNGKSLLVHSLVANDWSFYINDYNHEMNIANMTWLAKLDLLLITNRTTVQSELIIFDFKTFNNEITFDSNLIIFKYDFNSDIVVFNVMGEDILILTENSKYYHFRVDVMPNKGIKIDLVKIISFEKIFQNISSIQNIIKVSSEKLDLLVQENNQVIYLKLGGEAMEKYLLFERVEYISKIDDENYYVFNGDSLIILKDLSKLIENLSEQIQGNNSILKISTSNDYYPILLNLSSGLFITLENEILTKKSIQLNNLTTKNSIFLHDLIKFEINDANVDMNNVFEKYSKFKNFQYSIELLLYKTIEDEKDDPESVFQRNLVTLIKHNPIYELNVVSKCLRKIEIENWNKLLDKLELTSDDLINKSIELKQFKTLSILIIIFLNYNDQNKLITSKSDRSETPPPPAKLTKSQKKKKQKNAKKGRNGNVVREEYDEGKLLEILKLIYVNGKDEELWDSCFELLRFFKILDLSGGLLNKAIDMLEAI